MTSTGPGCQHCQLPGTPTPPTCRQCWWLPALPTTPALLTVLTLLVVVAPLVGIVVGLLDPPPQLFASVPQGPLDLFVTSGAGRLLLRSLLLAAAVAGTALVLGTWLAWAEQRCAYRGRGWLAPASLLPLATPSYLLAAVLRQELSPGGALGGPLGLAPFTGVPAAWLVLSLVCVPYVQLLVGAALARSSAAEEEAARSLGVGPWRRWTTVWLPRLRPAWAAALVLVALYALGDFGAVAVLDCPVITWRLYQAVELMRLGEAAALGLALLLATLPLVVLARMIGGRRRGTGGLTLARPAARRPLGPLATTATWVLHAFIIGGGVVIPVIALASWVLQGLLSEGWQFASLAEPLRHSLLVMALGCVSVLALAIGPAWMSGRSCNRLGRWVEHGVYCGGALPGVLLATGLTLLALTVSRQFGDGGLYALLGSSGVLLALGYAGRFIHEAFAPLRAAAQAVDHRQGDCARTLGAGPVRRAWCIHVPAIAPGLGVAAVLAAVAVLKELPITLLLGGSIGLRPLSYRIWERTEEMLLPDVGLSGLLLLGLALATVLATLRIRRHV